MITLPSLAGIPRVLAPSRKDRLAARYALALAPAGPIAHKAQKSSKRAYTLEQAALVREVEAWLQKAVAGLQIFRPGVQVAMGVPPADCPCRAKAKDPITIWLGNSDGSPWDSRWTLERRWREIERRHKGLAQTALAALDAATWYGIPVLTPHLALGFASYAWWAGEMDERYVLEEWHNVEDPAEDGEEHDHGVPRRAWFDKALPVEASQARPIVRERTLQWQGELGRQILELRAALKAAKRRRRGRHDFHTQADEVWCVGFGATLRWNTKDPIPRVWDDHANGLFESYHVEEQWGWLIAAEPRDLPVLLGEIESRFALARLQEKLILSIAERSYA